MQKGVFCREPAEEMQIERLKREWEDASAIVIGAGAGLSASAGFDYSGERFRRYFADFEAAYGFRDMYTGGFFPFKTPEEHWAYWSRFIYCNRYLDPPGHVYDRLFEMVKGRDYFVITTNVDHCFQKAGFDKKRLFYTQGDYGLFQCSKPCRQETFENEGTVYRMMETQRDRRIPSELVPICPYCGRPMTMNLRQDERFVEDAGWHEAQKRYAEFLKMRKRDRVLFVELGVGYNTPGIIKYPFWQMTAENRRAVYACINDGEAVCPSEIAQRAICISDDIATVLERLRPDANRRNMVGGRKQGSPARDGRPGRSAGPYKDGDLKDPCLLQTGAIFYFRK